VHNDGLGLSELPVGVTCIAAHKVGDFGPERLVAEPFDDL